MNDLNPYLRQIMLHGFGLEAQLKLRAAHVLVVGAGGLGCTALQHLNAMGVGELTLIDPDSVDSSNLHRQILYTPQDIGRPKVEVAAEVLRKQNPQTRINALCEAIDVHNALELLLNHDLVIDGSDRFETRYLLNDACLLTGKPYVYGALAEHQGQVGVFHLEENERISSYRDAFPNPPEAGSIRSCAEGGILGVYAGLIGGFQALEAVKILTGVGKPLANRILTIDFRTMQNLQIDVPPGPRPAISEAEFKKKNYHLNCCL